MENEKITIVLPFFKTPRESFIPCIKSIISQTYNNLEILVIDDSSGPEYSELLDEVSNLDSRIKIVKREVNRGLSAVRNYGLKICTGDFVLFVDSDDVLHHFAIQYLYENLVNTGSDMAIGGLCITNTYNIGELSLDLNVKVYSYNTVDALEKMITNSGFGSTACGRLASKKIWEQGGVTFIEGLLHEDLASTWEVICRCQKVCWVDANLYYYYQGGQSSIHSKNVSSKFCKDFLFALNNRNNGVVSIYPSLTTATDYANLMNCPNIYMYASEIKDKKTSIAMKEEALKLFYNSYKSGYVYSKIRLKQKIKIQMFRFIPQLYCCVYKTLRKLKGVRK